MIDVIITSTCRSNLSSTLNSFKRHVCCADGYRFIVHVDVLPRNSKYLPRLMAILDAHGIDDVHVNEKPLGHSNAVNYLYGKLRSRYFFHLEDDWRFLQSVDLDSLIKMFDDHPEIHQVRLNKERLAPPDDKMTRRLRRSGELYLLPGPERTIDGIPLIESRIWSFNPHLGRAAIVRKLPVIPAGINPENFVFKMYDRRIAGKGLFIFGRYCDPPRIKDTGRPPFILEKWSKLIQIAREPKMIFKKNRILFDLQYRGRSWE